MAQYNSLNAKLSNSRINKLSPAIKKKKKEFWDYHEIWFVFMIMRLIFFKNYYKPIDKLKIFVKFLKIISQLILSKTQLSEMNFLDIRRISW